MRSLLFTLFLLVALAFERSSAAFVKGSRRSSTSGVIGSTGGPYCDQRFGRQCFQVQAKKKAAVETVRKPALVEMVAERMGTSKSESTQAIEAVVDTIMEVVADGKKLNLQGFGTFKLSERKARTGRNPKTGESLEIKASKTPSFSAAKGFKEKCN
uniref:Uncharacterized protein n=1 Tax=Grammatophora oceanica TaxID=210454 RepID=A0A7S1Y344_9STRA|mmetsp:Transcript_14625/g.21531  ORF Transcript_14625/g.21531 Transcript_14625/m.21531 type:complete len:156 (+) Transcript_14625:70-537(+)